MPAGLDGSRDRVVSVVRSRLLSELAFQVAGLAGHPNVLVGVDGASGTGKSTLADELAEELVRLGRPVVRSTIDSFHRPRAERYRLGSDSPWGYYLGSHNLEALQVMLLSPFSLGAGEYVTEVFDEPTDTHVRQAPRPVPNGTVLVFDGLFLHRPELVDYWDLTVFLIAENRRRALWDSYLSRNLPENSVERNAVVADRQKRIDRYLVGQQLYEERERPRNRADIVIGNDDLAQPEVINASSEVGRRDTGG